jgi:hypothetical protein
MQKDLQLSVGMVVENLNTALEALVEAKQSLAKARSDYEKFDMQAQVTFRSSEDWMTAKNESIRKAESAHILAQTNDYQMLKDALDKAELDHQVTQYRYDAAKKMVDVFFASFRPGVE